MNESGKTRWLIAGGFLLILIAVLTFGEKSCRNSEDQEIVAEAISQSTSLLDLDDLCAELPKPSGLEFEKKVLGGNSFTDNVSHWFKGTARFEDIRSGLRDWSVQNGWEAIGLENTSEFLSVSLRKENLTISVEKGPTKYSYSCSRVTK